MRAFAGVQNETGARARRNRGFSRTLHTIVNLGVQEVILKKDSLSFTQALNSAESLRLILLKLGTCGRRKSCSPEF